ncbi:MAG TPA: hypothetical protein GXZ77_07350 [Papillibacter sp.]|jgi:hypothetical protein|nr:hypothetical protein [Papillibacter sp.]
MMTMAEKKFSGYPVYSEDELGLISQVASSTECTGLEATPPLSDGEAASYGQLYPIPAPSNNTKSEKRLTPQGDTKRRR